MRVSSVLRFAWFACFTKTQFYVTAKKNEPKATSDPKEDTGKNDDLEQASKELEKKLEPNDDEDANKANSSKGTSRANSQNDNDDTKVPSGKSSPLPQDKAENESKTHL